MPGFNWRVAAKERAALNESRLQKEAELAVQINERLKTLGVQQTP